MHVKGSSLTSRLSSVVPGMSTTRSIDRHKSRNLLHNRPELLKTLKDRTQRTGTHRLKEQAEEQQQYIRGPVPGCCWGDWGNERLDPGTEKKMVRLPTLASKGSAQYTCVCAKARGRRWKREERREPDRGRREGSGERGERTVQHVQNTDR